MSYHAGKEKEYLQASIMEWSVISVILGIHITLVVFNQHPDHFKVAMAAWEQDINTKYIEI